MMLLLVEGFGKLVKTMGAHSIQRTIHWKGCKAMGLAKVSSKIQVSCHVGHKGTSMKVPVMVATRSWTGEPRKDAIGFGTACWSLIHARFSYVWSTPSCARNSCCILHDDICMVSCQCGCAYIEINYMRTLN